MKKRTWVGLLFNFIATCFAWVCIAMILLPTAVMAKLCVVILESGKEAMEKMVDELKRYYHELKQEKQGKEP